MNPINLYSDIKDGFYVISLGRTDDFLCSPSGSVLKSKNELLIENIVFDLQKYSEVSLANNNSLEGEPLETVSLYSLFSTQTDFWTDDDKSIEMSEWIELLKSDPIANISPGPEKVDQIHQWRSVIKILRDHEISFHDIQYFIEDNSQIEKLAKLIKLDFDQEGNPKKAAFIQLNHLLNAPICVWAFIYRGLSTNAFVTALTQTGDFIVSVESRTHEKLDEICPKTLSEEEREQFEDKHYDKFETESRLELYEEIEKLLSDAIKFVDLSKPSAEEMSLLCEESISHEFKASLQTPYPDYPPREVSKEGKEVYILNGVEFASKKKIHNHLQDVVLKTIASLLNTQGGNLVIGVHEFGKKKNVVGIDREGFTSHDKYERHLVQLIKNSFGSVVITECITTKIVELHGKFVCLVSCKRYDSNEPVFFKDKLYVRTGPRVDELTGKEQAQFILKRVQRRNLS